GPCAARFEGNCIMILRTVVLGFALASLGACAAPSASEAETSTETSVGLPNPAAVHCIEQGGQSEIREDADGGQYGVCVFEDGRECLQWPLLQDERCEAPDAA